MRYNEKYPEKGRAASACSKISFGKDIHRHHWSYNQEHWRDLIPLSIIEHNTAHRFLIYDQERRMYRRSDDNILLDTRKSHVEFLITVFLKELNITESEFCSSRGLDPINFTIIPKNNMSIYKKLAEIRKALPQFTKDQQINGVKFIGDEQLKMRFCRY